MQDPRKQLVASGYDGMSDRYLDWSARVVDPTRDRLFDEFSAKLPDDARVLDLGCGAGVPWTRRLAVRFDVVGVDISEAQIRLARENVPEAAFVQGDMAALNLPEASFDAVTAFYAISHIPREQHPDLFRRIAAWLKPGGLLLATLGATDSPGWAGEWLGVPMFFSAYDADANRFAVRNAGLELLVDEVAEVGEPEGNVSFLWVLARKTSDTGS
jgi:ubiquinone/menaquinone biosynthesis C-methylase UbiE